MRIPSSRFLIKKNMCKLSHIVEVISSCLDLWFLQTLWFLPWKFLLGAKASFFIVFEWKNREALISPPPHPGARGRGTPEYLLMPQTLYKLWNCILEFNLSKKPCEKLCYQKWAEHQAITSITWVKNSILEVGRYIALKSSIIHNLFYI